MTTSDLRQTGRARSNATSWILLAAMMASLLGGPARADTYPAPKGVQIGNYAFDVELSDASDRIKVAEALDVAFSEAGVRTLALDLCNVATAEPTDPLDPCQPRRGRGQATPPVVSRVGKGMTVASVSADGAPLRFEHRNDRLLIFLPRPSAAGGRMRISLSYGGAPAGGLSIGKDKSGERVFFSDNWPNKGRNWLATIDHVSSKATGTISVTAPSRYQVISNGALKSEVDLPGALRRTTWRESVPIPVWQFALGAAPMAVHELGSARGVELSAWLSPDSKGADLQRIAAETRSAVDFYSERLGPFPYEKLANVEASGGIGAMEFATAIFYNDGFEALPHEIGHQWFGNSVTERDWDDVWLSEAFATYLDLLHTEHVRGREAFLTDLGRDRAIALKYALAHPADTIVHPKDTSDSRVLFNAPQIYFGGAMVLHTLRGVLGDERFWGGLRLYYQRYRNGSASTEDFRHAMQDACTNAGDCPADLADLSWFFDQWLRRGGVPQVKGLWWYDAPTKTVVLQLTQTQGQGPYRIPVEVALRAGPPGRAPSEKRSQIVIANSTTSVSIPVDDAPIDVRVDPDVRAPLMMLELARR